MDFVHKNNKISVQEDAKEVAFLSYKLEGNVLTVEHTVVSPQMEGQGIGNQLVKQIVEYARDQKLKIIPQCPFANRVIQETPEYQDVLKN